MNGNANSLDPTTEAEIRDLEQRLQVKGEILLKSGERVIAVASLVIYASLMIGILMGLREQGRSYDSMPMVVSMVVTTILSALLYVWLRQAAGKAAFTVGEDGWRDANGTRFGWDELRGASIWSHRGNQQTVLELTDDAYARVIEAQSRVTRALTKGNAKLLRTKNAVILPGNTDVPTPLLTLWVNQRIERISTESRDDRWGDQSTDQTFREDYTSLLPASRR